MAHKGFENTKFNDISGIEISGLLMNIMFCHLFVNRNNSTVVLSCRREVIRNQSLRHDKTTVELLPFTDKLQDMMFINNPEISIPEILLNFVFSNPLCAKESLSLFKHRKPTQRKLSMIQKKKEPNILKTTFFLF